MVSGEYKYCLQLIVQHFASIWLIALNRGFSKLHFRIKISHAYVVIFLTNSMVQGLPWNFSWSDVPCFSGI